MRGKADRMRLRIWMQEGGTLLHSSKWYSHRNSGKSCSSTSSTLSVPCMQSIQDIVAELKVHLHWKVASSSTHTETRRLLQQHNYTAQAQSIPDSQTMLFQHRKAQRLYDTIMSYADYLLSRITGLISLQQQGVHGFCGLKQYCKSLETSWKDCKLGTHRRRAQNPEILAHLVEHPDGLREVSVAQVGLQEGQQRDHEALEVRPAALIRRQQQLRHQVPAHANVHSSIYVSASSRASLRETVQDELQPR